MYNEQPDATPTGNWWEGPPPTGFTGAWPPPLPPGGSYGPNYGQVIYPLDANGNPTTTTLASPLPTPPPAPAPTPTDTAPAPPPPGPGPAAAPTDYDFATAKGKIEAAIGRPMTPADVAFAFQTWGGNESSRFSDAGIAPVIAHFTGGGGTATGGGGTATGGTGGPGSFGGTPTPYASDPNAPGYTPMGTYVAPQWTGGDYVNPTQADLEASPGYAARLNEGLKARERSAAAQGTVLNGGTLKALDRYSQDYASNEYQTLRSNTYDAYKTRYGQFQDAAGMNLAARTVNANDANTTYANRTAAYTAGNQRTLSEYLTNVTTKRNSELDYWNRLMDLTKTGASAASGSYK